jgi:enoyl-CoA hydratase
MTEDQSSVVQTSLEGGILSITINRPESMNALNTEVLTSLREIIKDVSSKREVRVGIITGTGKAFVAGADIQSMNSLSDTEIAQYVELGQSVMRELEYLSFPVIAAINGYALGGGLELALSCDILIGSSKAKLGQPEVNLGVIPGFGGTQRLIHRCGIGVARRLCYTGEVISAEDGLRMGLLDQVCEPEELESVVKLLAETIAQKGPLAVAGAKEVIRRSQDAVLSAGLDMEVEKFLELFKTEDRKEGMTAFLEKRTASFLGR